MSHIHENSKKIKVRIKKIKGQLEAVEKNLDSGKDCYEVLQTLAAAKGAMNSLFGELIEEHIQEHILHGETKKAQDKGAQELIKLIKTYWK